MLLPDSKQKEYEQNAHTPFVFRQVKPALWKASLGVPVTAPLFSLIEEEHPITDSDITDVDDFICCLNNNRCFDPIRETEEFKSLIVQ